MPAAERSIAWLDLPKGSAESAAMGKTARAKAPRTSHATWRADDGRPDPVSILRASDAGRVADLVPLRYGRMLQSPFTFYRGAAAIMARDLSTLGVTGIRTQICGDAHLLNFGGFATPERNLVFDVNDFDETTRGAWEWDLKRLVASIAVAGRHLGLRAKDRQDAVLRCAGSYRGRIGEYANMHVLDVWYSRLDAQQTAAVISSAQTQRQIEELEHKARAQTSAHAFPKLTEATGGRRRFIDEAPLTFHPADPAFTATSEAMFARYRDSMPEERRSLLDRFSLADVAYRVVGVGSVGTRCLVALYFAGDDDPLILQAKEAMQSVLQPYVGGAEFHNQGRRVVTGQRLMQAASDLFLGWSETDDGHAFYVRQLRDMKTSANIDRMTAADLAQYAEFCGWALAHGHAKGGGVAAAVAGYLGRADTFDVALATFAETYADQNERDYRRLQEAVKAGELEARVPTT